MTDDQIGQLGLADVLQQLGEELREAQRRGGETIAWMSAEVEIEVAIETTGSGGVRFWVLNGQAERAHTHLTRIKVNLSPVDHDGEGPAPVGM